VEDETLMPTDTDEEEDDDGDASELAIAGAGHDADAEDDNDSGTDVDTDTDDDADADADADNEVAADRLLLTAEETSDGKEEAGEGVDSLEDVPATTDAIETTVPVATLLGNDAAGSGAGRPP
jgi:hypothetical protein